MDGATKAYELFGEVIGVHRAAGVCVAEVRKRIDALERTHVGIVRLDRQHFGRVPAEKRGRRAKRTRERVHVRRQRARGPTEIDPRRRGGRKRGRRVSLAKSLRLRLRLRLGVVAKPSREKIFLDALAKHRRRLLENVHAVASHYRVGVARVRAETPERHRGLVRQPHAFAKTQTTRIPVVSRSQSRVVVRSPEPLAEPLGARLDRRGEVSRGVFGSLERRVFGSIERHRARRRRRDAGRATPQPKRAVWGEPRDERVAARVRREQRRETVRR